MRGIQEGSLLRSKEKVFAAGDRWIAHQSAAFQLMVATSWLAPELWRGRQEQTIRDILVRNPDWNEYLYLVKRHRTPVLSWAALQSVPCPDIPATVRQQLQSISKNARIQAVRQAALLTEILRAFNRAAIPIMILRGPLFSLKIYGDISLRQSHDLDMACSLADVSQASRCLESLGWKVEQLLASLTDRQRQSFMRYEHHVRFTHAVSGCFLELHYREEYETAAQTSARLARSRSATWQGYMYREMAPTDLVPYLSAHGGRHSWFRIKWLGDLARLHAAAEIDWPACLNETQEPCRKRLLLATLLLLKEVYGLSVPELGQRDKSIVSSFLLKRFLQALRSPEIPQRNIATTFTEIIDLFRYYQITSPWKIRRELFMRKLFFQQEDYIDFPLPDRFFWAYIPLRPVFWIWRRFS